MTHKQIKSFLSNLNCSIHLCVLLFYGSQNSNVGNCHVSKVVLRFAKNHPIRRRKKYILLYTCIGTSAIVSSDDFEDNLDEFENAHSQQSPCTNNNGRRRNVATAEWFRTKDDTKCASITKIEFLIT